MIIINLSCSDLEENDPITTTLPVFSETPVNMAGPFIANSSRMGDILFSALSPAIRPFGANIENNQLSPYIDYFTIPEASVRAISTGIISEIIANPVEQGDYEIQVTSLPGSDYTIVYDHIQDVTVLEGIQIEPGEVLGVAGTWGDNVRRTSLGIYTGEGNDLRWYCPLNYGDAGFNQQHQAIMQQYHSMGKLPDYDSLCISGPLGPSLSGN